MPVIINGRTAVHKESKGVLVTQDDCYTGPNKQVVTYQNVAKSEDAENCAKTVFINGNPICHKNSYFSKSTGDESGDGGGVQSGTIQGKAEFVTASPNVFIEDIPAVRAGDLMVSNNRNTPPAQLQQPSPPFGGDQDKINKFPEIPFPNLTYDLDEIPLQGLPTQVVPKGSVIYDADVSINLKGQVKLQKKGQHNPINFSMDGYEVAAKEKLNDFFDTMTIVSFNAKNVSFGSSIAGYYTTTVNIVSPLEYDADLEPQPLEKIYEDWKIAGNFGFNVNVKFKPQNPTFETASIFELSNEHEMLVVGGMLFAGYRKFIMGLLTAAIVGD